MFFQVQQESMSIYFDIINSVLSLKKTLTYSLMFKERNAVNKDLFPFTF